MGQLVLREEMVGVEAEEARLYLGAESILDFNLDILIREFLYELFPKEKLVAIPWKYAEQPLFNLV